LKKILLLCFLQFLPSPVIQSIIAGDVETQIKQPVRESITILQKTQKNEEEWRLMQERLTARLQSLQTAVEQLTATRDTLNDQITSSKKRIEAKNQQLADIMVIEQEIDPFLDQLIQQLKTLPEDNLPFLVEERKKRIAKLSTTLHDPNIDMSEKYRKVMETLQIEAEFGVTIETYQEMINSDDQQILVNILRLGRLGLYYVKLDESGCGFYNIVTGGWQELNNQYIHPLQTAIAIASKRQPAEFINIPLGKLVQQ
jgi:PHD/YefM family antitoxin component YafN of YafNO toxin-antitoxin module